MHRPNITSIIEFIAEFFSELPPTAVAAISGIGIFAIIALCGGTGFIKILNLAINIIKLNKK